MATTDFWGTTGDGYLNRKVAVHYSDARDAAIAEGLSTGANDLQVGWFKVAGLTYLYRSYLYVDTSGLTGTAETTAGELRLRLIDEDSVPGGHQIVLLNGGASYPGSALGLADFDRTKYKSGGAANVVVYGGEADTYKTFTLNSTGRGWVNPGGVTTFCLMSVYDVSPTNPGVGMFCRFNSANIGGDFRPRLRLTYGTRPTVSTTGATGIAHSSATVGGVLDATGSNAVTEAGAIWNDDGSDPVNLAGADNSATGGLVAEAWSVALSGLTSQQKYQYRAYATSAIGTGYGSTGSFTTATAPATLDVRTLEATSVFVTGATLRGNIVSNGGDGITQHGFVWKENSDPYEEASPISNPTGAANYKLLGTGSEGTFDWHEDGLSSGSVYLYRAFAQTTGGTDYGGIRILRTAGTLQSTTIYGMTGDGFIQADTDEYESCSKARLAACTGTVNTTGSEIKVRGDESADFRGRRGFIYFDTSSLTGTEVLSFELAHYISYYPPAGGDWAKPFHLRLYSGMPTRPSESGGVPALTGSDITIGNYSQVCQLTSPTGPGHLGYYTTTIGTGSLINKSGLTKFMVTVNRECDYYGEPNSAYFYSADNPWGTARAPKLIVSHVTPASGPPLPGPTVGGTVKKGKNAYIRVGGQDRLVTKVQIMIGGTWKDCTGG